MDKVFIIKGSLRCYTLGCLAVVPILGLIPALFGIRIYMRVQSATGEEWNPARRYLYLGCVLSWLGGLLSTVMIAVVLILAARHYING